MWVFSDLTAIEKECGAEIPTKTPFIEFLVYCLTGRHLVLGCTR